MAHEIERKFLLANDSWRGLAEGVAICQGYLSREKGCTVRVRLVGKAAVLTIKGANVGATRLEFEYPIPVEDAAEMLRDLASRPLVEKTRYTIVYNGFAWEVDEFHGDNQGLVLAELELADEKQPFPKPDWIGEEVTEDPRYYNSNLVAHPFTKW